MCSVTCTLDLCFKSSTDLDFPACLPALQASHHKVTLENRPFLCLFNANWPDSVEFVKSDKATCHYCLDDSPEKPVLTSHLTQTTNSWLISCEALLYCRCQSPSNTASMLPQPTPPLNFGTISGTTSSVHKTQGGGSIWDVKTPDVFICQVQLPDVRVLLSQNLAYQGASLGLYVLECQNPSSIPLYDPLVCGLDWS